MNDQEIIRKAVELADGWHSSGRGYFCSLPGMRKTAGTHASPYQVHLDCLAAQLVRQVDLLRGYAFIMKNWEGGHTKASVRKFDGEWHGLGTQVAAAKGPDRTMNTLKAIVESKVLETD